MRKRIISWFSGIAFLWMLPYIFTMMINGIDMAVLNRVPEVEDFLPISLSMQIPENYSLETIEAQAVIARTNLYRRLEKEDLSEIFREWREEIQEARGVWKFPDPVYERAVEATEGEILVYNGELKLIPYHEISSGRTRDGETAFHSEEFSYLKAVESSADKDSPSYINSTYISEQQLPSQLNIEERDESGYIVSLTADGNLLEGESFAMGMGLSSSDFTMQKIGTEIRFLCKGKGHGLGLSQYGGNEMAKSGSTWDEILETYFPAMELASYTDLI